MSVCWFVSDTTFGSILFCRCPVRYQTSLLFAVLRVALHWNFVSSQNIRLIIAWSYINYKYGHQQVQRTATAGTQILVKREAHVPPTAAVRIFRCHCAATELIVRLSAV
jgi:hypothetical protein